MPTKTLPTPSIGNNTRLSMGVVLTFLVPGVFWVGSLQSRVEAQEKRISLREEAGTRIEQKLISIGEDVAEIKGLLLIKKDKNHGSY